MIMTGEVQRYDSAKSSAAQDDFCEQIGSPCFAPRDGICPNCGCDIYEAGGITVDYAGSRLVTGCPFCRKSFCD